MLKVIFFICVLGIVHTYIIYPIFMIILGKLFKKKEQARNPEYQPTVEIIFAAYNEVDVIEQKLRSSLNTHYNPGKLSIRLGSDASNDGTDDVVKRLQKEFPQIHFKTFEARTGKAGIINQLVPQSTADLLILTDANIIFEPETIPHLVSEMACKNAGIVGGKIAYKQVHGKGISKQEDIYLKVENAIKQAESDVFAKTMGVEGGCYIIKRELFETIPPLFFMEDFYISMSVIKKGFDVKFLSKARCYEDVSTQSEEEYKRKVRISIGNFQNLGTFSGLLIKQFFPAGFLFLSHKVLRWLTPFFLLLLIPVSTLLAPSGFFYALFAGIYMTLLGLGMFGILFSQNAKAGLLKYPGHFIHMNLALLEGFTIYLKGVKSNAWQPTRRNQE